MLCKSGERIDDNQPDHINDILTSTLHMSTDKYVQYSSNQSMVVDDLPVEDSPATNKGETLVGSCMSVCPDSMDDNPTSTGVKGAKRAGGQGKTMMHR